MPWATKKKKDELENVTTSGPHAGRTHGRFPRTSAGHARAAGQIAIMERAEAAKGGRKRKRNMFEK